MLGKQELASAIKSLKFGALKAVLDSDTEAGFGELLADQLLLSGTLILKHPDPVRERRRDKFFAELTAYCEDRLGEGATPVTEAMGQLVLAEEGYRRIVAALVKTEFWKMSSAKRASAALTRSYFEASDLFESSVQQLARQRFNMPQNLMVKDGNGRPHTPDLLIDSNVLATGATLFMLAYQEKWFRESDDVLVIPPFVVASETDVIRAGSNLQLANAWRAWETVQERARFLGARIGFRPAQPATEGSPACPDVFALSLGDVDWYDFASTVRSNVHSNQDGIAGQMLWHGSLPLGDVTVAVAPVPDQFVSISEAIAFKELSRKLAFPIGSDQEEIAGLRIAEWLRGLAVLSKLADKHFEDASIAGEGLYPVFPAEKLIDYLQKGGLSPRKGRMLVEHLKLKKTSWDLFDAPLIEQQDGTLLLFIPAVLGANHATILLSIFANLKIGLDRKGKAFEKTVRKFLQDKGLVAKSIKETRSGETYDYDVVFVWDDYVFLLECKNRSIPQDRPLSQREFHDETGDRIKQVRRLMDGLTKHPDIFTKHFGPDVTSKTIVPVVLNNLPYARFGPHEGIYFYDFAALHRFFDRRHLNLKIPAPSEEGEIEWLDVKTVPLWEGTVPRAKDLMAQIESPFQLRIHKHHSVSEQTAFPLDDQTVCVWPIFRRIEMTPLTLADMSGIPRSEVLFKIRRNSKKAIKRARKLASGAPPG